VARSAPEYEEPYIFCSALAAYSVSSFRSVIPAAASGLASQRVEGFIFLQQEYEAGNRSSK
jgi:hypothetical protein